MNEKYKALCVTVDTYNSLYSLILPIITKHPDISEEQAVCKLISILTAREMQRLKTKRSQEERADKMQEDITMLKGK